MARRHKRSIFSNIRAIIGNKNTRVGQLACTLCDHYIMGNSIYVIMLGLIGTVITAFDIIRIVNCKVQSRPAIHSRHNEQVPLDIERDLKLMTSILGIEHYTLIMLGAITEYPMLHTPWLLMQLCVIIVETIVFCVKVFLDGLHMKRDEILLAFLTMHNWLQNFSECQILTAMALQLGKNVNHLRVKVKKEDNEKYLRDQLSKVEALYAAIIYFTTHCLSCITFEAGGRSFLGNPMTKSTTFNALFKRTYNLKIVILTSQIITGLITTSMIILGDKYRLPYLYVPWLVNTMQGMTLCEGPALFYLAYVILPNFTVPTTTFTIITFLLYSTNLIALPISYLEEFFILYDALKKFLNCWKNYCKDKEIEANIRKKGKYIGTREKKLPFHSGIDDNANTVIKKLKSKWKTTEFCNKTVVDVSTKAFVKSVKSMIENNNYIDRNESLDIPG